MAGPRLGWAGTSLAPAHSLPHSLIGEGAGQDAAVVVCLWVWALLIRYQVVLAGPKERLCPRLDGQAGSGQRLPGQLQHLLPADSRRAIQGAEGGWCESSLVRLQA